MIDLEQINSISTDELSSIQNKITKELDKRSGSDIDIKKLRAQVYKLAKSMGCEWVPDSLPGETLAEDANPKRRGRKPRPAETAETPAAIETKPWNRQQPYRAGEAKTVAHIIMADASSCGHRYHIHNIL